MFTVQPYHGKVYVRRGKYRVLVARPGDEISETLAVEAGLIKPTDRNVIAMSDGAHDDESAPSLASYPTRPSRGR
jgi:hypothetical protein